MTYNQWLTSIQLIPLSIGLLVTIITFLTIKWLNKRHNKTCNDRIISATDCQTKTCRILYATQSGTSKRLSHELKTFLTNQLQEDILDNNIQINLKRIDDYEPEDNLLLDAKNKNVLILIISTYSGGTSTSDGHWFCQWLQDFANDFRVDKSSLKGFNYAIFGIGDKAYGQDFCLISKNIDQWFRQLEAIPIVPIQLSDVSDSDAFNSQYTQWMSRLSTKLATKSFMFDEYDLEDNKVEDSSDTKLLDIEDIMTKKSNDNSVQNGVKKDMITTELRKELTKQGYRLIGTHSGVKLCRWTKAMLRGRGGCYKHSFYGIESHRCMETTPSLACANKCVFCWRHHTNPVGTEWKWSLDDPKIIFEGALSNHYQMINEFKGVPGVLDHRLNEAMQVRHCALSLVGEPIMYPHINSFVGMLHNKHISTFLVTNAQFPDAIKNLDPVTQLYVSVDASSKQSLKSIDRPLFRDFWERFKDCLTALSLKGQRTVYRLTLVKSWNVDELEGYAYLIGLGNPDFIEIKGVTYCGTGKDNQLTMANVPFHEEVLNFSYDLLKHLNDKSDLKVKYGMACEHNHSNCVLIANTKFLINNRWHTWIDYNAFDRLIQEYYESNGTKTFSSLDYIEMTPDWAVIGSQERGFDPNDTRFYRNRKNKL
ncbi:S-adenosyl-L-methionine-dependent tRNA 4-demethylwyosine synthase TYW1-like [Oppia nitens]|uniref:S-adenosyl-L-methionine-dependent tRNA 4-demethylwyosine synthase TYW1-like n=1 Tax=Oppia nitens TaxID=1686743 RepID=UPI0023DBCB38|nr:S-adenosyl-L-methionine-dependent tRNA 4-demethylwyosine synthase TYW1-like [Oppia nitens]